MKRWLCSLLLAVEVVFLLCISHRSLLPHLHPQDQSVLGQREFVSTWCRALPAAIPAFAQSRASPLEFFASEFGRLNAANTDDNGPPWLDYRGPPGTNISVLQDLFRSCKAAGQAGGLTGSTFQRNSAPPGGEFKLGLLQQPLARVGMKHESRKPRTASVGFKPIEHCISEQSKSE